MALYVIECFDAVELGLEMVRLSLYGQGSGGGLTKQTFWWGSVIDCLTRINRQMRHSLNSCKSCVIASPCSQGGLQCP